MDIILVACLLIYYVGTVNETLRREERNIERKERLGKISETSRRVQ